MAWCLIALSLMVASCWGSNQPEPDDQSALNNSRRWFRASCSTPLIHLERTRRGLYENRGPDLTFIPHNGNTLGNFTGSSNHSGPWGFLQNIPLLFYGPGHVRSQGSVQLDREVTLADVVPTVAQMLQTPPLPTASGKAITEVLPDDAPTPPRLVLFVVWDGAGWNVLNRWPGAWPFLRSLMADGTVLGNATVGSSPSITPAVHTTFGTGAFPDEHGIVNITQRDSQGTLAAALGGASTKNLEIPTLADVYDRRMGNEPQMGLLSKADALHLGMLGHGASIPGGDRDIAAFEGSSREALFRSNDTANYSLPSYLQRPQELDKIVRAIDAADGRADGSWLGHQVLDDPNDVEALSGAPVWTVYQTRAIESIVEQEGFGEDAIPDLFFTNYKEIDYLGHRYTFVSQEVRQSIQYADRELQRLTEFLNDKVGSGEWVMVMTADHGQTPPPQEAGTWPINVDNLRQAIDDAAGAKVVLHLKQNGLWLDERQLERHGVTRGELSNWLLNYTINDNAKGMQIPEAYRQRLEEPIFDAAFPSRDIDRIMRCSQNREVGQS
jgi:Type I phosphodiesterase / nucleotide pyrophosphatase